MKKFIIQILLLITVIIVSTLAIVVAVPHNRQAYLYEYVAKERMLREVPSPRIIFVGGSNLAFGLDSGIIADSLGLNVVNYGLHGGLGLKYMIDDVARNLQRGDIVVVAPEYEHFYNAMYGGDAELSSVLVYSGWKNAGALNVPQLLNALSGLPLYVRTNLHTPAGEREYSSRNFNAFGDETVHWSLPSEVVTPSPIEGEFDAAFTAYFARKIEEMRREHEVVVLPPVLMSSAYDLNERKIGAVAEALEERGTPFQMPTRSGVLPDSCAYDTQYHMNRTGAERNTYRLLQSLDTLILQTHQ